MFWLCTMDMNEQQDAAFALASPGTGTWIFESLQFKRWIEGSGKSRLLRCPGNGEFEWLYCKQLTVSVAGVGKTILAWVDVVLVHVCALTAPRSIIINDLRSRSTSNVAVVFFYFKYTNPVTLVQVLEALLAQLASVRLSTHKSIQALEDHWAKQTRPSRDQLLSALQHELSSYPHVYIVIDALDELPEDLLYDFVDILRSSPTSAHILMTSRDIPSISTLFPDDERLDILADDHDMRTYIEGQVGKPGMLSRQINIAPSIKEQVVAGVIEKARGMYGVRHHFPG
jgi:hypothetical protein